MISNKDKCIFDWFTPKNMKDPPYWGTYGDTYPKAFPDEFVLSKPAYESQLIREFYDHEN